MAMPCALVLLAGEQSNMSPKQPSGSDSENASTSLIISAIDPSVVLRSFQRPLPYALGVQIGVRRGRAAAMALDCGAPSFHSCIVLRARIAARARAWAAIGGIFSVRLCTALLSRTAREAQGTACKARLFPGAP